MNEVAHSNWGKFGIPLLISGGVAIFDLQAGIAIATLLAFAYALIGLAGLALKLFMKLVPSAWPSDTRKEIESGMTFTFFLGVFALAGIVLRDDNLISRFVFERGPSVGSVGFIDPIFALVCIGGVWLYTTGKIFYSNR